MEEISKEEAIEYFKRRIKVEKRIVSPHTCDKEVAERKKKHIAIFEQAISDMEKLQKIEEVIANSTFHPNNYMASVELLKIIKEIEQIVKGE